MRIGICVLILAISCSAVTWVDIAENWLHEGDNMADLNGDGIVNFEDFALTLNGSLSVDDFTSNFDSGQLTNVAQVGVNQFTGQLLSSHNRWFYFKVDNCKFSQFSIEITNHPQPNAKFAYSFDNETWQWDTEGMVGNTIYFDPGENDQVWIARMPVWTTYTSQQEYINSIEDFEQICIDNHILESGRHVSSVTITDPFTDDAGKRVVYLIAGQHPWERLPMETLDRMMKFLAGDSVLAEELRQKCIFVIIPMASPDGIFNGWMRTTYGADLNRHWGITNPRPEIAFAMRKIEEYATPSIFIDFHSGSHNLYWAAEDGPETIEKCRQFLNHIKQDTTLENLTPRATSAAVGAMTLDRFMTRQGVVGGTFEYWGYGSSRPYFTLEMIENDAIVLLENIYDYFQAPLDLTDDCVGFWKFNETQWLKDGDVSDSSTYSNHGTAATGLVPGTGKFGNAAEFAKQSSSSQTRIQIPHSESLNFGTGGFTITAWINLNSKVDKGTDSWMEWAIMAKYGDTYTQPWWGLTVRDNTQSGLLPHIRFAYRDDDMNLAETMHELNNDMLNNWVFVTGVRDGKFCKLYVDGKLVDVSINEFTTTPDNQHDIKIGQFFYYESFDGRIDAPMVFNRALMAEEITFLHKSGIGREYLVENPGDI